MKHEIKIGDDYIVRSNPSKIYTLGSFGFQDSKAIDIMKYNINNNPHIYKKVSKIWKELIGLESKKMGNIL